MEITFLGTGSMLPTKERNGTAVLLTYRDQGILFDCGEGTQRQLRIANIPPTKITKILVSHWHGDHVFGLPGLILTLGSSHYQGTLEMYGPKKSKQRLADLRKPFVAQNTLPLTLKEVDKGVFYENDFFKLEALPLEHSTTVLGYSFIEQDKFHINLPYIKKVGLLNNPLLSDLQKGKDVVWQGKKIKAKDATTRSPGKKITFITDTKYCANAVKLAKHADVLICESTYMDELKDKAKE
ncbi:MBL fold metallo-hydrolase, partial [Candidatus Woesearchaeota archaeon]|nr:MBL fold metallo-hydrolase [Candidatus Woesearchaeota archaeon]